MRRLIADVYMITYRLLGFKYFSLAIAIVYVATLNLITVYGLSSLLQDVYANFSYVVMLFDKPLIYLTVVAALLLNLALMFPLKNLSKLKSKPMYHVIIIYSLLSLLLFFYMNYFDVFFNK